MQNRQAMQSMLMDLMDWKQVDGLETGADPASAVRGVISVIFGCQVSLRVHYCKRDEVCFTTLL